MSEQASVASDTLTQSLSEIAWGALWRALVTDATYNHGFGIESAWRQNNGAWGYPLETNEIAVMYNGQQVQGRNFSAVGLVVWLPGSGAQVVGRPQ